MQASHLLSLPLLAPGEFIEAGDLGVDGVLSTGQIHANKRLRHLSSTTDKDQ